MYLPVKCLVRKPEEVAKDNILKTNKHTNGHSNQLPYISGTPYLHISTFLCRLNRSRVEYLWPHRINQSFDEG